MILSLITSKKKKKSFITLLSELSNISFWYLIFQMIKVFVVDLCCLLEYEVTESSSLSEVQKWVAQDSGVAVEDQRPLLPRGQPPDPTRPAIQCWAPPVRLVIVVLMF